MAVIFGLAVLALLALPGLAGFRATSTLQICLGNQGQLTRAWLLYAEDNNGQLPGNLDGGDVMNAANTNRTWAIGWLDYQSQANTNTAYLRDAQLGAYLDSVSVFRCPLDPSLSRGISGEPRVRSVSMNSYVGARAVPYTGGYRQFATLQSIVDPAPSGCLVFLEEREDSINDGCFFIDMNGYNPSQPSQYTLVDYPAARHDGDGVLSFADGHAEAWRWVDSRTRPVVRFGQQLPLGVRSANSPDVARIQASASRKLAF